MTDSKVVVNNPDKSATTSNALVEVSVDKPKVESATESKKTVKGKLKKSKKAKKGVKFIAPSHLYVDFQEGTDKAVLESVKERIFSYARDNATVKSDVKFNIKKVEKHSYFPDGYIYEIIEGGSGHSVLPMLILNFKEKSSRAFSFELAKGKFSVVEKTVGGLVTYLFTAIPSSIEKAKMESNNNIAANLYVTSYMAFYVSMFLVVMGVASVCLSMMFKYVLFQEEKVFVDERHYNAARTMPIDVMLASSSTDTERMTSVQYSKQHGWFLKKEIVNDEGISTSVMDKIGKRGGLSRIKLDENGEPVAERKAKDYSKDGVKLKNPTNGA
jgi:hypothetical protein